MLVNPSSCLCEHYSFHGELTPSLKVLCARRVSQEAFLQTTRADAICRRPPSTARRSPAYSAAWSTTKHAPAVPESLEGPRRRQADEWRRHAGASADEGPSSHCR